MRRLLPLLPPALLAAVAGVQFTIAQATPLSAWKGGGFGMFSTSDRAGMRTLRVRLDTEAGPYVVAGPIGEAAVRVWPRQALLRAAAREAACAPWRLVPLDSLDGGALPGPEWGRYYRTPAVREQTALRGLAVPADSGAAVRGARAEVVWLRLDVGERSVVAPEAVASASVSRAEAGCGP